MSFSRRLQSPAVIFAVALVLRLSLIVALGKYHMDPANDHDTFGYETGRVARSLAAGQGFSSPFRAPTGPTAILTPLYPLLVASVFKAFGTYTNVSALVILSLNSLFSALTCLVIFQIGKEAFGSTVAALAAWVWALHPSAIHLSIHWVWEMVLTTLLVSAVILWSLRLGRENRLGAWLGFGILCGLNALSNPAIVAVLPFLWGWLALEHFRRGGRPRARMTAAALGFVLVIAPWFVRNYLAFHEVIPFRSNFGIELYIGNNAWSSGQGVFALHPTKSAAELDAYRRMGEIAYIAEKKRLGYEFIASHPGQFVKLTLRRVAYFWTGVWQVEDREWYAPWLTGLKIVWHSLESVLAFLGLGLAVRAGKKEQAAPFALLLLFYPLSYYITHVEFRYDLAIEPAMVLLAIYALQRTFEKSTAGAAVH